MSDDEDSDGCSIPLLVDSDDEDSDESVSPPWILFPLLVDSDDEDSDESVSPPWIQFAACEWASFAHRLFLRQELRDKHYMMRRRQNCSRLLLRQELRGQALHGCPGHGICVTQFCPGHGKGRMDQTFTDTVMGRLPITRYHYGRLLWALAKGHHPLSKTDRVKLYLNR
jgi:hypothetical protein